MRNTLLLLPILLAGCWPYIAVQPTPDELNGVDGVDPGGPDTTDNTTDGWDSVCADGPNIYGPWSKHPLGKAGVDIRGTNYTFDAGVGPVLTKALANATAKTVDLQIDDAIVTAVGPVTASAATLWVADKDGTVVLYKLPTETTAIQPGDRVRVHVTEVVNYSDVPEVTAGSITVSSSGDKVWVEDAMDGSNLSYKTLPEVLVEAWGELISKPVDCGSGYDCFDLDHGSSKPTTFRVLHGSASRYDCVHAIAPLDGFDGDTELTMVEDSWFQTY